MGWSAAFYALTTGARKMEGRDGPMKIHTIGIDLGKTSFHLRVGLGRGCRPASGRLARLASTSARQIEHC